MEKFFVFLLFCSIYVLKRNHVHCRLDYSTILNENLSIDSLDSWFEELNSQYKFLNHRWSVYSWTNSSNLFTRNDEFSEFLEVRNAWRNRKCNRAKIFLNQMTSGEKRMMFMLCRGPIYRQQDEREVMKLLDTITKTFDESEICLSKNLNICENSNKLENSMWKNPNGKMFSFVQSIADHDSRNPQEELLNCLRIEDLENLMNETIDNHHSCSTRSDFLQLWLWNAWRTTVGPTIVRDHQRVFDLMNSAARNNGYKNIDESWREKLEMANIEEISTKFWTELKPFYELLHGVVRNIAWNSIDDNQTITKQGTIPVHLLRTLSSSDWSNFLHDLLPFNVIDLDENIRKRNWTKSDLIKRAEDFYISLSLKPMTRKFWNNSIFNQRKCHSNAVNMFDDENDDFRIITCPAEQNLKGFSEIVHIIGQIEYFMHASIEQPVIFQDSVNSVFEKAITGAIFLATITPQHLNRLNLLPDEFLYPESRKSTKDMKAIYEILKNPNRNSMEILVMKNLNENLKINYTNNYYASTTNQFDISLLLKMALSSLPAISHQYIVEKIQWECSNDNLDLVKVNDYFWKLMNSELGIHRLDWKNHYNPYDFIIDYHKNNPDIVTELLKYQIFKGLCEYTIFGKFNEKELQMPLHRCDIYGSKRAGTLLKKAMKLGGSKHWSEVLHILTGKHEISSIALLEYYQPLILWLEKFIIEFDIPTGW